MYKPYKKPFLKLINLIGQRIHDKHFTDIPIYIGGCGRSGTTLMLSILSSHQKIFACPQELGLYHNTHYDASGNLHIDRIDRLNRTFIMNRIEDSNTRWCEKSPSNIHHLKEIEDYHEGEFKFINIVRDGRDVILSKHPTAPDQYWVDPERWITDVGLGFDAKDHPNVYTVRYEDLVLNFQNEIIKICDFLSINVSEQILNWHEHTTVKRNSAYFGNVQDIFKTSIGKWKKPENQARAQQLLKSDRAIELLQYYNYDLNRLKE